MSLSAVCIFQLILFLYEYLAWQLEIKNFTTHKHYREIVGTNVQFFTVQINSLPHLAAAYVYYHRMKRSMFLYIPYLLLFTFGQLMSWWLPYFFRIGFWYADGTDEKLRQYQQYHAHYHRILPRFKDHEIIPDTEHTILIILTCITFVLTIRSVYSLRKSSNSKIKTK